MSDYLEIKSTRRPLPDWVPVAAARYLLHVESGLSIRAVARASGCHASTVLRQIRRFEARRDDPLIDQALVHLGRNYHPQDRLKSQESVQMPYAKRTLSPTSDADDLPREALRILRRLCENGAVLAVAMDMDKAVVVKDLPGGKTARTAVVSRDFAQTMALKNWIICDEPARVSRYHISPAGRAKLRTLIAEFGDLTGFAEAKSQFSGQMVEQCADQKTTPPQAPTQRQNLAESPLAVLARRKDKTGKRFLSDDLVTVGEQFREDFELAQMEPHITQNWEKFLTAGCQETGSSGGLGGVGPSAARGRVSMALQDLGPGLGDMVLRCCCYLEGMEAAEQRMGWSARSGKIVLRIALQRLKRHYDETVGPHGAMIG